MVVMGNYKESHKESGHKILSGCKKWELQFSDLIIQFQNYYKDLVCFYFFSAFPSPPPTIHPHVIHPHLSTIEVGIVEDKEEVGKKNWLERRRGIQQKNDQRRWRKRML